MPLKLFLLNALLSVENIVLGGVKAWKRLRRDPAHDIASIVPQGGPDDNLKAKQRTKPTTSADMFWADQRRTPGAGWQRTHCWLETGQPGIIIPGHSHCGTGKDVEEGQAAAVGVILPHPRILQDLTVLRFTSKGHGEICGENGFVAIPIITDSVQNKYKVQNT